MNYLKIGVGCAFIVVSMSLYAFFKQPTSLKDSEQLVVGTAAGYAPFVSINAQGEYEGFDIDVARHLAKKMGKKLVLKDLGSMSSLFVALDQGNIDLIIWGLSITQDRLKKVAMVNYQGEVTQSYPLLFWNAIPEKIKSIVDMKGMVVCVEPGSSQEAALSRYEQITMIPIEKVDDALLNIQYGKTNAAFVEPAIAKKFKNKYPQIQLLEVQLFAEDIVQGVGMAIKKENAELISAIEKAIAKLKNEGTIRQLEQKWDIQP